VGFFTHVSLFIGKGDFDQVERCLCLRLTASLLPCGDGVAGSLQQCSLLLRQLPRLVALLGDFDEFFDDAFAVFPAPFVTLHRSVSLVGHSCKFQRYTPSVLARIALVLAGANFDNLVSTVAAQSIPFRWQLLVVVRPKWVR
jgi:hypothetical protein